MYFIENSTISFLNFGAKIRPMSVKRAGFLDNFKTLKTSPLQSRGIKLGLLQSNARSSELLDKQMIISLFFRHKLVMCAHFEQIPVF
jgi:hypothetical protein